MTTRIARKVLTDIRSHAEAAYPEECCGLLIAGADKTIIDSLRMINSHPGPKMSRYSIDPMDFSRAEMSAAKNGLAIKGVYHSHPDHHASLSEFDVGNSIPLFAYLVLSVPKGRVADTRLWLTGGDKTAREDVLEAV